MAKYIDPLIFNTMLDANLLDEVVSGESAAVNRIMELCDSEDLNIVLPYSVRDEVNHPKTLRQVREAANQFIYSIRVELTDPERARYEQLVSEARGKSQRKNVEDDLYHIFESGKYGGGHFVTRDGWLLRNTERIWESAHVEVVPPEEFVEKVETALAAREG